VASLIVVQGNDQGKRFELRPAPMSVGRDASNPIRLRDHEVSRKHAELRPADGEGYRLFDLGSANGTYVNGHLISEAPLRAGDRLQIGQTTLLFSPGPTGASDITRRVDLLSRAHPQDRSAIIRSLSAEGGSRGLPASEATSEWLRARMAHLAVLYQATQAISHVLDLDALLPQILQLVFESIGADRGAILLGEEGEPLVPKAVRWRGEADPDERLTISQTIVDHVRETGEAVVTSDAPSDARFSPSQSIAEFAIREAICVPIRGRHTTLGVLYADALGDVAALGPGGTPTRGRFSQEQLLLMIAIGHQAGLAIENTQFHQAKLQAERLAAVGQTIAVLSHHIKNILQGLRSGSYLIDQGLKDDDQATVRKGWTVVEKNQTKIYNMVLDMLSFAKEREPQLEQADLNATVAEVVELIQPRADEMGVKLSWAPDPDSTPCWFDPEALHRAVLNIASNALEACEDTEAAHVEIGTHFEPEQGRARIIVRDNGPGIAPEDLPHLFQVFASTKGNRGTGLGLPVSEKILREHGGEVQVTSGPGRGACFELILPLKSPAGDSLATMS
jgi:signal transduction histidine kinase